MNQPEVYYLNKGTHVPNNRVPALVYRNVLPRPLSADSAQILCEGNHWQKRGERGAIKTPHFHPNTHECYAVFRGRSRLVLGREKDDTSDTGVEVDVEAGDVVVVPAGVSHRSLTSEDDYRYIGVYPETSPKWRNNFCKGEEDMAALESEIEKIDCPEHDPVYGKGGPLVELWKQALRG